MQVIEAAQTIRLLNGVEMPQIGLGTWPMKDEEVTTAVKNALQIGYRLIDTAEAYGNETGVGEGMRASGVARSEVFLTTKFNKQWHSIDGVREACEASLKRLGTDYIDLYLIHWPNPAQDRYVEAFQGLVKVMEAGLVRSIGVSNFKSEHLERLFALDLVPHVNQIQLDPYHLRDDLVSEHKAHGIVTECWGPLGRGDEMLKDPRIVEIAERQQRAASQIVLRWHVQSGHVATPKSGNPERQAANLDVFGFELSDAEMAVLNAMDRPDPDMLNADVFGH